MTRVVAAGLVAVVLAGCGSPKDSRRSDVNQYIARVNSVQRAALAPWARAGRAYTALARGAVTDRQLRALDAAPKTIRSVRARIAALKPPGDARRLHAKLLRLLGMNVRFAEEVSLFAHYVRAVGPLEKRLRATTAKLRLALKRSKASAAQQSALTAYAASTGTLATRFLLLKPPPALATWHAGRVARVVRMRDGARELAAGLAHNDQVRAERSLAALTGAAASSAATPADRRAIIAYNARLKRIRAAAAAVAREERRLVRELT